MPAIRLPLRSHLVTIIPSQATQHTRICQFKPFCLKTHRAQSRGTVGVVEGSGDVPMIALSLIPLVPLLFIRRSLMGVS